MSWADAGVTAASGGAPVLVLLPPLGEPLGHFDLVRPALPTAWPVLVVERPRRAPAPAGREAPSVRTLVDDLADLDEALRDAGDLLLLVGASYGGLLARVFATRYPHRVVGLVLVDAVHEDGYEEVLALVGGDAARVLANPEGLDLTATFAQARRLLAGTTLGDLPVAVLAREGLRPDELAVDPRVADVDLLWRAQQESLAAGSPGARLLVVPGAGHLVAREQPEVVAEAVLRVATDGGLRRVLA